MMDVNVMDLGYSIGAQKVSTALRDATRFGQKTQP